MRSWIPLRKHATLKSLKINETGLRRIVRAEHCGIVIDASSEEMLEKWTYALHQNVWRFTVGVHFSPHTVEIHGKAILSHEFEFKLQDMLDRSSGPEPKHRH